MVLETYEEQEKQLDMWKKLATSRENKLGQKQKQLDLCNIKLKEKQLYFDKLSAKYRGKYIYELRFEEHLVFKFFIDSPMFQFSLFCFFGW